MKFYVLIDPLLLDVDIGEKKDEITVFTAEKPFNVGDAIRCPKCGAYVSMLKWIPPFKVAVSFFGKKAGDIAFGGVSEILFSERFRDLFIKEKLIGLDEFKRVDIVKVRRKSKKYPEVIPNYYVSSIARSKARIDEKMSEISWYKMWTCSECKSGMFRGWQKIVIEEGSWSGEDIFIPRIITGLIITSEKFMDFYVRNKITNGLLIDAEEYSRNFLWPPG